MHRRIAVVVAVIAVALLLWLLVGRTSDPVTNDGPTAESVATESAEVPIEIPAPNAAQSNEEALATSDTFKIDLESGPAGVEGTVFAGDGSVVADAPVTLYRTQFPTQVEEEGGTLMWQLFRPDTDQEELFDVVARRAAVRSDADGAFAFLGLEPGSYVVASQTETTLATPGTIITLADETERSDVFLVEGSKVHGQVLQPNGAPVADADVTLEGLLVRRMQGGGDGFIPLQEMLLFAINSLKREVKSNDTGEFEFVGLPQLDYRIRAGADPWADSEVVLNVPVEDEATLILAEAAVLVGRVVDPDGHGVADADVTVNSDSGDRFRRFMERRQGVETKTNADGEFRLPRLEEGPYSVEVQAPTFQTARERVQLVAGGEEYVEIRMEEGGVLRGVVVSAPGKPIEGVTVRARQSTNDRRGGRGGFMNRGGDRNEVETNDRGVFLFDTLEPGEYRLEFRHRAWLPQETIAQTGDEKIEIQLASGEVVSGRVLDPAGAPIAEARVSIRGDGRGARPRSARTDDQGFFQIGGIQPEPQTLSIRSRGFTNWETEIAGTADLGDIVLSPAVIISGVVLDPAGQPLPGARVQARQDSGDAGGDRRRGGRGGGDWRGGGRRVTVSDRTDADGYFEVQLPEPEGEWTLTATQNGFQDATLEPIVITGADVTDLVLQLSLGAIISGTVTGPTAEPVANATVSLRSSGRDGGRRGRGGFMGWGGGGGSTRTEADGSYQITGATPGQYTLRVQAEGYASKEVRNVELFEGTPTVRDVRIDLAKELTGIVVDIDGAPIAGAELFVFGNSRNRRPQAVNSHADGTFTVPGLGDEEVQVRVSASGYSQTTIEDVIAEESPLRITLDPAYELVGVVVDGETGDPVRGARVSASLASGNNDGGGRVMRRFGQGRRSARSDSDGVFTLSDLEAGDWTIEARSDGFVTERVEIAMPLDGEELTVVLRPGGRVRGVISNTDGDLLANALVEVFAVTVDQEAAAEPSGGGGAGRRFSSRRALARDRTDEDGSFLIEGVPEGTVRLEIGHDDYLPLEIAELEIKVGGPVPDLRQELERGAEVRGRLMHPGDSGLRYLRLSGGDIRSRVEPVEVGEGYSFSGLAAGSYTIRVQLDRRGRDVLHEETFQIGDKQRMTLNISVP